MWAAVAALFIATVLLFSGGAASRSHSSGTGGKRKGKSGAGMFGRGKNRGQQERGSFIDRSSFESKC